MRIEGAKKKLVFATELSKSYDAADMAVIRDKVRNAPENIRILWNRFEGDMKILNNHSNKGSWYEHNSKQFGIVFDMLMINFQNCRNHIELFFTNWDV